jgi:GNAT superfamily N-acetyltransferase
LGDWEGAEEQGIVRLLWYERGQRQAGQALLEAAEGHLRGRGLRQCVAFDQYAFRFPTYHLSCAQLTDRWEHVHGLLGANGYQRSGGEVFLDWEHFRPPDPGPCPIEADLRVERWQGRGSRDNVAVHAERDGERLGICASRCCGEYSSDARAQDWLLTNWLWVEEGLRGQGVGRYLLLRALTEARAAGFVHAAISAEPDNHRAILFYSNIGYHAVDWTTEYRKGAESEPT